MTDLGRRAALQLLAAGTLALGTPALLGTTPLRAAPATFPAPLRTRLVRTSAELARALAEATYGTHILLADGTYAGNLTFKASGTATAPIVVRAVNPLKAVLTGSLNLAGQHGWVHGLKFTADRDYAVKLLNDHASITRCWFAGARGITLTTQKYWQIGYNKFTGHPVGGQRCDHIYINVPDSGANLPDHGRIFRNYFTHKDASDPTESHHVYVGNTWNDERVTPSFKDLVIEHNLVDNSSRRRGIYVKRGCTIQFNHVVMTRGACLIRGGENGKVWGNRLIGMQSCAINGRNHDIRGNYWRDTRFELMSQHLSRTGNRYIAADNALLVGNDGDLVVGELPKSGRLQRKVGGVKVYAHAGKIAREAEINTLIARTTQLARPTPITLAPSQVGPDAA